MISFLLSFNIGETFRTLYCHEIDKRAKLCYNKLKYRYKLTVYYVFYLISITSPTSQTNPALLKPPSFSFVVSLVPMVLLYYIFGHRDTILE